MVQCSSYCIDIKSIHSVLSSSITLSHFVLQTPSRLEPVLTDKEVILASLNIKSMAFSNTEYESQNGSDGGEADTQNTILSTLDAKAPL